MPHMNMRFPTVITLPWRADAAEFWFARLSHLPFAMLLHSGHADHPYSRFDILVADPLKTLTTDDLSLTDDPLKQLQQASDADAAPALQQVGAFVQHLQQQLQRLAP